VDKVKLIYNPVSGRGDFDDEVYSLMAAVNGAGFFLKPHRLESQNDMQGAVSDAAEGGYSSIIVAGGDGTVNSLINHMIDLDVQLPVYIVPAGTSNALAHYLQHSADPEAIAKALSQHALRSVDIGRANGVSFANVLAAGFPSNVAHEVATESKHTFGMLAYFMKGLEQLTAMKSFKARITLRDQVLNEDLLLMLVMNSGFVGRLLQFAPLAKTDDGLLDILLVKACGVPDLLPRLIKIAQGEHVKNEGFVYLQTDEIRVECLEGIATDVDGELGPPFPLNISVLGQRMKVSKPAH
jgi:YegS/Rv2252/BmrU family lipid kinase